MKIYADITKVDAEQRLVFGYASTEALDSQGEVVRRDAVEAALPDYMRFANIREMHQPSAVGVAEQAMMDDRGLYLAARVVDDAAWEKVKAGVYKGFSIGGRVTARDPRDTTVVSGLTLTEISLVDRPANPEAVFDLYKGPALTPHATTVQPPSSPGSAEPAASEPTEPGDGGGDDLNARLARLEAGVSALLALASSPPAVPQDDDDDEPDDDADDDDADDGDAEDDGADEDGGGDVAAALADLARRVAALEAAPGASKGVLKALSKAEDGAGVAEEAGGGSPRSLILKALARPQRIAPAGRSA